MATALTQTEAAARAELIDVESYAVFLDLTGQGEAARTRTEIRFSCMEPGSATFADIDAGAVHEVFLNGLPLDPSAITGGRLPLAGLAADNTLVVEATVATGGGLTRYADPADGGQFVLVSCFPTAAPSVFCCFDQPDLRATMTLIVTAPAGWTCVSNGAALHHPDDGAAGVWRFAPVTGMKPYEFTLCAGPYVVPPGTGAPGAGADEPAALTVRCRPSLAASPGLAKVTTVVAAALRHYEQLLGVPRPYPRLDIVFAPGLGPFAMQTPGVMCVSERLLQRAADAEDEFVPHVLAHEVAHLWFGCLVEGRWWDDLWLAEAMASYLSYDAATAVLGQGAAWAEFGMDGQASAYQADSLPSTQPVASPVPTAAEALTQPAAITYSKGTSVIRQLAAVIGEDAMRAGLHDYLTSYAWTAASLADLIDSWSRASGSDLTRWAGQWLQQPGTSTLQPELMIGPDGVITSLAVVQEALPLREHRLTVGLYELDGLALSCRRRVTVTVRGSWTHVPELTGTQRPAAIILNDADLTFARIRLDPVSWRALVGAAMDVGDPVAEAVCWQAAFDLVASAELDAAELAAIVARRISGGGPGTGLGELLERARAAAEAYAPTDSREAALRQLAAAALATAEQAPPGSRRQKVLARGFAACADSPAQLDLLRFWLRGRLLPAGLSAEGLAADLLLRATILATLAARDQATAEDLARYADDDPVSGDTVTATCAARRPSLAAKQAAWAAALAPGRPARLARAHADGIWVPGQEELMAGAGFRERYFGEALPSLRTRRDARTAQRLARTLYPVTLADEQTLAATHAALAAPADASDPIRPVLAEQAAILRRVITARTATHNSWL